MAVCFHYSSVQFGEVAEEFDFFPFVEVVIAFSPFVVALACCYYPFFQIDVAAAVAVASVVLLASALSVVVAAAVVDYHSFCYLADGLANYQVNQFAQSCY